MRRRAVSPRERLTIKNLVRASDLAGAPGATGPAGPATTDASLLSSGTVPLARISGLLNAQIAAAAAIAWSKLSTVGSSLADLATRSASDLTTGTLALARLHADVPLRTVAEAIAGVWAFTNGLKERGRASKIGEYVNVAYSAANFTASAGTWTVLVGSQATYAYYLIGDEMTVVFTLNATSNSAAAGSLRLAIPGGYVSALSIQGSYRALKNGGAGVSALWTVGSGGTYIDLYTDMDAAGWTAGGINNYATGAAKFKV